MSARLKSGNGAEFLHFQENYPNIIYQRTKERETLYCAWNRTIKLARGLYLTNGNTDDRHCFNALEIMANYLDNNREISLVYADQLITTIKNDTLAKLWVHTDRLISGGLM